MDKQIEVYLHMDALIFRLLIFETLVPCTPIECTRRMMERALS